MGQGAMAPPLSKTEVFLIVLAQQCQHTIAKKCMFGPHHLVIASYGYAWGEKHLPSLVTTVGNPTNMKDAR